MADAENILRDVIDKILEEKQCEKKDLKINEISTQGANYTSALFTVTLITDKENLELFAKVAKVSDEMRKVLNADRFYEIERRFYTNLAGVYEWIQENHNVAEEHRVVFPRCYGIDAKSRRETVVMENLMAKGYQMCNRFDSMDWEHAAISVEMIAKFHALSFAYENHYPVDFEFAASMDYKRVRVKKSPEKMFPMWPDMVNRAVNVIDERHRDKVRALMMEEDILDKFHKRVKNKVIVHGDYRLSNILFKREDKTLKAIPVDYQLVHSGNPAEDLVYLIFLGTDEEFRRQYYDQLIDHYYEQLCQALRRLDVEPVEAYPRETFDTHLQEMLPYALFIGVVILPIVVVGADSAPKMSDDTVLETIVLEPNALFADRFRGIVNDCVRWGVI